MIQKPWLSQYGDVPHTADYSQFESLGDLFDSAFKRFGHKTIASNMGKSITYTQVDTYAKQVAAWLQSLGLSKGDRVAIMMPNCFQYMILVPAILRAGYAVTNINPLYTADELRHQLNDSGAKAIFLLENFASTLQKIRSDVPELKHIVVGTLGDMLGFKGKIVNFVLRNVKKMVPAWALPEAQSFKAVLKMGASLPFKSVATHQSDLAFLQYTGGTTGVSKGAALSHGNLLANVKQAELWCAPKIGGLDSPIFVAALPLYHIFGLTVTCMYAVHIGGHVLLITNPRDIPAFVKDLAKYPFAVLPAVNTLFVALLNNPEFRKLNFSSLKVALAGGMAAQRAVAEDFHKVTGVPLCEAYGLSETSPAALMNPVSLSGFTGYTGLPISSTEVAILDEAGAEVPIGTAGEIAIRGPQVMAGGYWNRPEETAKVMTADGYFLSGDIGIMNEQGYVKIVDRKKNMILVSGFNVYPNELEDVAVTHPKVLEAAAIGVPDDYTGEAVKMYVVKKDQSLTEDELQNYLKESLTGYKRPKTIVFRDELPKTNVGKILHRVLRDE